MHTPIEGAEWIYLEGGGSGEKGRSAVEGFFQRSIFSLHLKKEKKEKKKCTVVTAGKESDVTHCNKGTCAHMSAHTHALWLAARILEVNNALSACSS